MIICLKTRLGEIHIVNWTTTRGLHYTNCGKAFSNKNNVETFGADNVFPDMCPNCYSWQETQNVAIINDDVREHRNNHVLQSNTSVYYGVQKGWESTKDKFEDTLDRRYWPKKSRMRRKFPQEDVARTKKKRKSLWKLIA